MTKIPIIENSANQWTGFYMIGTSVKKELTAKICLTIFSKVTTYVWQDVKFTSVKKCPKGYLFRVINNDASAKSEERLSYTLGHLLY